LSGGIEEKKVKVEIPPATAMVLRVENR